MARPILLSNGELHVGLNHFGLVHDFYFPYVGLENHSAARNLRHRIGVWVNGDFSWFDDGSWTFAHSYPYQSLVGRTVARHERLGLLVEIDVAVDFNQAALLRNIHVVNLSDQAKDVRFYLHQVLAIGNGLGGDTVQHLPHEKAILHYKGHRAFVAGGQHGGGGSFDDYCVGLHGIEGHDGTYRDAEDGSLGRNPVEHGSVDSVIGFYFELSGHDSHRLHYWLTAAKSIREALVIHQRINRDGLVHRMLETDAAWQQWLKPAEAVIAKMPVSYRDGFRKSLLILKSHIDKRGAVIASTDTTMLNYSRDTYAYCWPRDAALVLWPLVRLGYRDEPMQFLQFCRRAMHPDGYMMHKYQADGALGSSWHPYLQEGGQVTPPIQADESAVVLFLAGEYFDNQPADSSFLDLYRHLIAPMANFLSGFTDTNTKLPHASYDLWEERSLTSTYTTAVTYAGLSAAAKMAERNNFTEDALRWQSAADDIRAAAQKYLFNTERGYFYRGLRADKGDITYDSTIDASSFYGAFMFGLFDFDSPEVKTSYKTLLKTFGIGSDTPPALPRYENDQYDTVDRAGLGNPWIISSLWLAQYNLEGGNDKRAKEIIDWVQERMLNTGVLPEQINPYNNSFISVAPLTWSQAEFLSTVLDLVVNAPEVPSDDKKI